MRLFYEAASAWSDLLGYAYSITYGFKKTLYTINLSFDASHFHHLAGFQYLPNAPAYNKGKIYRLILNGTINCDNYERAPDWRKVEPRLKALVRLQKMLDGDFFLYRFNPIIAGTNIEADFLITDRAERDMVFLFLGGDKKPIPNQPVVNAYCKSIFIQGFDKNYTQSQRCLAVIRKEKSAVSGGDELP